MTTYVLGDKATIAVAPKFGFKLLKNEIITINEGKYRKNTQFRTLESGGQIRKITEAEAEDLLKKGYRDVTNGRKQAEPALAEAKVEEKETTKPEGDKKPEVVTLSQWLQKADKTTITKWLEEADDTVVSAELFEELAKIDKVGDLRKAIQEKLDSAILDSAMPA